LLLWLLLEEEISKSFDGNDERVVLVLLVIIMLRCGGTDDVDALRLFLLQTWRGR
jgi:hypothetical protein